MGPAWSGLVIFKADSSNVSRPNRIKKVLCCAGSVIVFDNLCTCAEQSLCLCQFVYPNLSFFTSKFEIHVCIHRRCQAWALW